MQATAIRTLGPYRLLRQIGEGGMAEVYLAEGAGVDGTPRQLAIKVLHTRLSKDDKFVRMLLDEARVAVRLEHPNIVRAFELGRALPHYFISMEYVAGVDLHQLLRLLSQRNENLPPAAALYIAQQLLRGLDYVHNVRDDDGAPLQLIHRDISPSNVLVSRHGEVKIADFGVARAAALPSRTVAGEIKGKLGYMSPEQANGQVLDRRSDIFSAGVVLFEALTSKPLYGDISQAALIRATRSPSVPPPSRWREDLPQAVDSLLMPAVAANPDERYQTAAAFERAVTSTLAELDPDYVPERFAETAAAILSGEAGAAAPAAVCAMRRQDFVASRHSVIAQQAADTLPMAREAPRPVETELGPPPAAGVGLDVDPHRPTLIDVVTEQSPVEPAELAEPAGPLRPGLEAPSASRAKTLPRVALGTAPTAVADLGPTLPPPDPERAPPPEPPAAGTVTSATTAAASGITEAAQGMPPQSVHGAPTVLLGPQDTAPPLAAARPALPREPAALRRELEHTAESPALVVRESPRGGRLLVVGLVALLLGGAVGAGAVWLLAERSMRGTSAGSERRLALASGGSVQVGTWVVQLERVSIVATSASEQLVARLRLARAGAPAGDGGRYFFLQWAGGYESPTVVPGETGDRVSLSFRLPKGAAARAFDVRFAPPDAASAVLGLQLP